LEQAEKVSEALGHDDALYLPSGSNDLRSESTMGELGEAISLKEIAKQHQPETESLNRGITGDKRFGFTLTHAFFLGSGVVVVETTDRVRRSMPHPILTAWTRKPEDYPPKLLAHGCPALFSISQEEILDKSKADIASKTITLFQTLWFAIQGISRAAQHLAISTLEIFTISMVSCSLVSILLWWHKPKDVSTQSVIRIHMTNEELEQVLAEPRPNYSPSELRATRAVIYLFVVFASFSASVPLLAWHFSFATHAERTIWNVFAVILLFSCLIVVGYFLLIDYYDYIPDVDPNGDAFRISVLLLTIVYALLRLYFVIEAFIGLRSSPVGLYESVDWSLYLPHF